MNRTVLYSVVGVLSGAAATTVGTVMSAKRHSSAAVDSLPVFVDSSRIAPALAAVPGSDTVVATPPDTAAIPAVRDSGRATIAGPDIAQRPGEPPTIVRAVLPSGKDVGVDSAAIRAGRLAKLFGAMSAKDAAKVLVQLDDADVQQIVSRLSDKQAATVLANFPADRAAAITKLALRRPGQ